MFQINEEDKSIYVTRGDVVTFSVSAETVKGAYTFHKGDTVRFTVYGKKNAEEILLRKDFLVSEETEKVSILLTEIDTRIGEVISKPTDYWYEIELNPLTNPQTIIGYDEDGAKVFKLFPEGDNSGDITKEDIPVVDNEFSTESERPLQNAVITMRFSELQNAVDDVAHKITSKDIITVTREEWEELHAKGIWKENTAYVIKDESSEPDTPSDIDIKEITRLVNKAVEKSNDAIELSQEAAKIANASAKTITYQANVSNIAWTEDAVNGGYFCNVTVTGMLSTDNPIVDIVLGADTNANVLYLESWAMVTRILTSDNAVTLYANRGIPSTAFTIQIKVVR